mgnify:CR=1 FL=1
MRRTLVNGVVHADAQMGVSIKLLITLTLARRLLALAAFLGAALVQLLSSMIESCLGWLGRDVSCTVLVEAELGLDEVICFGVAWP